MKGSKYRINASLKAEIIVASFFVPCWSDDQKLETNPEYCHVLFEGYTHRTKERKTESDLGGP